MIARFTLRCLSLSAAVVLSGCGWLLGDEGLFPDRSQDYKKAPEYAPMAVPEEADARELQEIYVIPEVRDSFVLEGDFEVPRPTPLVAGAGDDVVRIQRLGDESWALVSVAPGQLWPQVRRDHGVQLASGCGRVNGLALPVPYRARGAAGHQ